MLGGDGAVAHAVVAVDVGGAAPGPVLDDALLARPATELFVPGHLQAGDALLVQPVTDARFTYSEGTLTRSGLVRLYLEVKDPPTEESVDFLHEVHVRNVP